MEGITMNKQVEKIKAEIERWKKELRLSTSCEAKYRREMLDDISEFIESLQKEPVSEDLKKAAKFYADTHTEWFDADNNPHVFPAFKAGVNWQKEQMLKDTVDADAVYMTGEGTLFNPEVLPDNIKPGDKVKIIIVKEEVL